MVKEPMWKEGAVVSVALDGEEPRAMRVVRMRRSGPNTIDLALEAASGPNEIVCTCPYRADAGGMLTGVGTSRTCEMHGDNKSALREKVERLRSGK